MPLSRATAGVQSVQLAVGCAPHLGEQVAARPAHLRPDDGHDQVGGDRRVDRAAAVAQDVRRRRARRGSAARRLPHPRCRRACQRCRACLLAASQPMIKRAWRRRKACTTLMATRRPVRGLSSVGHVFDLEAQAPEIALGHDLVPVALERRVGDHACTSVRSRPMPARLTAAATLMLSGNCSAPSRALPANSSRGSCSALASSGGSSARAGLRV